MGRVNIYCDTENRPLYYDRSPGGFLKNNKGTLGGDKQDMKKILKDILGLILGTTNEDDLNLYDCLII